VAGSRVDPFYYAARGPFGWFVAVVRMKHCCPESLQCKVFSVAFIILPFFPVQLEERVS
jgi:hypothetical protein